MTSNLPMSNTKGVKSDTLSIVENLYLIRLKTLQTKVIQFKGC